MTTIEEMIAWRKKHVFDKLDEIARAKGADYSGKTGDTFKNIRLIEVLSDGVITTDVGLVTRMTDKFSRMVQLLTREFLVYLGQKFGVAINADGPAVKDESVEDSIRDYINYLTYELVIRAERWNGGKLPLD